MIKGLPLGWTSTKIGELCELLNGRAFKTSEWSTEGTPIIRIQNLKSSDARFNYYSGDLPKRYHIENGDLLFAWSGTPGTSFGAHIWYGPKAYLNQHIFKVEFNAGAVNREYLCYALNERLQSIIDAAQGGVGLRHITKKKLEDIDLVLPPLNEQINLVKQLGHLQSKSRKAKFHLEAAKPLLEKLRQSILAAAFRGDLTAEWRKNNPDVEPASVLLERIRKERRKKWEEAELEKMKAKGKEPKNDKWKEKYKKPEPVDTEGLPELPEGWCWVSLGTLAWSVKDGPHYSPKYQENGIPFISGGNVRPEGVDFKNVKYISKELHEELKKRCFPQEGDILYTKGGTTGIARVNTYDDIDFNVWVHVAVLKIISSIEPFFLQHALNSPHCYEQSQVLTRGVGNQDLGLTRMINISVPVAPEKEQIQVLHEIRSCMDLCRSIEGKVKRLYENLTMMDQSILAKAFRGELVPQDPNDEPASVLLERIKTEREADQQKTVNRKRK